MPPSAPSQSSPLAVSLPDDSAKPKAGMSDVFGTTPVSTHPSPPSSLYQDPYSSSMWNNGMMGAPSAMNSYPGMMYGGGLSTPFLSSPIQMMPNTGPFSNITNYLLGLQNVILSIGQVVQIVSFNTHSLQHLCESILAMFEHAVRTWHEQLPPSTMERSTPEESEQQQQQRQRRIRALRYAAGVAFTYLGYTIVRAIRNRYRHSHTRRLEYGPPPTSYPPQYPPPTGPIPSYYNHASSSYPPSGMPPYHHPYQNQNHPYSGGPTW